VDLYRKPEKGIDNGEAGDDEDGAAGALVI
jgi:hypothetical protein